MHKHSEVADKIEIVRFTEEVIGDLFLKSLQKIKDSGLYSQTLTSEVDNVMKKLPNTVHLFQEINAIRAKTPDAFSTKFYGQIIRSEPCKFTGIENRALAVLVLTKLCTLLLGALKEKETRNPLTPVKTIADREMAGLEYLGGYVLHKLYVNLRKSKDSQTQESQEMMALLKSCQNGDKPQNQKLVFALDRNGLWYGTKNYLQIIITAENYFVSEIAKRKDFKKIDSEKMVLDLIKIPKIMEYFRESVDRCDIRVADLSVKNTLQCILELFLKVRCFNYAKDMVQKFKLNASVPKKSLRKNLKTSCEENDA